MKFVYPHFLVASCVSLSAFLFSGCSKSAEEKAADVVVDLDPSALLISEKTPYLKAYGNVQAFERFVSALTMAESGEGQAEETVSLGLGQRLPEHARRLCQFRA